MSKEKTKEELEDYESEFENLISFDSEICPKCGINFSKVPKYDPSKDKKVIIGELKLEPKVKSANNE